MESTVNHKSNQLPSLWVYFIFVFVTTWLCWIPAAWIFSQTPPQILIISPSFVLLQTLGAAMPSLVAIILLKIRGQKKLFKSIVQRYKNWKVPIRWYLAAVLIIPTTNLVVLLIRTVILKEPLISAPFYTIVNDIGWIGFALIAPIIFISQIPSSPLLEEFGWRGYALPQLQHRFSALQSSLILGLIWGLWHLPLIFAYQEPLLANLINIIGQTIILTWIFNSTKGSMITVILYHASLNFGLNIVAYERSDWLTVIITWIIVLYIIRTKGSENLSLNQKFAATD